MNRRTAKGAFCAAAGLMLFLSGCASSPVVKIMPYVGISLYPPTDPGSVMVLAADPPRPHRALGNVIVEPEEMLSIEESNAVLRRSAASIGAHAVVILQNMAMKTGADWWGMYGGSQVIVAVAIRYTDETS